MFTALIGVDVKNRRRNEMLGNCSCCYLGEERGICMGRGVYMFF